MDRVFINDLIIYRPPHWLKKLKKIYKSFATAFVKLTYWLQKIKGKFAKGEVSELPVTISSYIRSNYATAVIKQAGKNAEGAYFVGISIDSKIKILLFNADGTFGKELEKPEKGPNGGPEKH